MLKAEEILLAALEKPTPAERAAYLDAACGQDAALRAQVEGLLRSHQVAGSFLEQPLFQSTPTVDDPLAERPGTVIGPYKLLEQIGEGGFGVVFMAEQTQPIRRRVALKVLKPGMDTRQVIARFEAERQALALMDHPNIARVIDGGMTGTSEPRTSVSGSSQPQPLTDVRGSGRPFFVMELVRGVPITDYCDQVRMPPRERLDLFLSVCQAIQHAHQKGIIHRDIKPSNVMVTEQDGKPLVKIIDFGIAKATGQQLTEKTLFTNFAQMIGTPLYMSPEQAGMAAGDVDTRSDIYSLGVLLYELLTGTTPFDSDRMKKSAYDEIRRIIREEDPPKPSNRLSESKDSLPSISAQRHTEPAKLTKLVRGELDWIVMKALEKDRNRRYETANGFAHDLQRYLANEPVQACPPSAWYRCRKFARRNKGPVLAATLLLLAIVSGSIGTTWGLVRAEGQRSRAVDAEKVAKGNEAKAHEEAQKAKNAEADTRAFGDFLVQDILHVARPEGVQGGLGIGVTVAQALEAAEANLDKRFAGRPLAEATARHAIGNTWRNLTKFERAERHLRRAVELRGRELGPDDPATVQAQNSLGVLLWHMGRYLEAIALHEEVLNKRQSKLGPDHADTLESMHNLALAYDAAGKSDLALILREKTLKTLRLILGPDHSNTLLVMQYVANAYRSAGKLDLALQLHQENLERRKAKLGPDNHHTLFSMNDLALTYQEMGKLDLAIRLFEQALAKMQAKLGPDHHDTLNAMGNLGAAYQDAGRFGEALSLFEDTFQRKKRIRPDHSDTFISMRQVARAYLDAGRFDESVALFQETIARQQTVFGPDNPGTLVTMNDLAVTYQAMRKLDLALPLFVQALAKMQAKLRPDDNNTLICMANLGTAYRDAGRLGDAFRLLEQSVQKRKVKLGSEHPSILNSMSDLASVYELMGKFNNSVTILGECLAIREKTHPDDWRTFNTKSLLGGSLIGQEKYVEAEPLLLSGYEGMKQREKKIPPRRKVWLTEAIERLVKLYEAMGKNDQATEWREKLPVMKPAKPAETKKD